MLSNEVFMRRVDELHAKMFPEGVPEKKVEKDDYVPSWVSMQRLIDRNPQMIPEAKTRGMRNRPHRL